MNAASRSEWLLAIRASVAKCRANRPIPSRDALSISHEHQCRILGGHLIHWLEDWGPAMIRERNALAGPDYDKNPVLIFATDMRGPLMPR
jgi:hypothetical protein